MNDRVVFRNPAARSRPEAFGGAVKVGSQVVLLGHAPYRVFQGFNRWQRYGDVVAVIGLELLEEFLGQGLFLAIEASEAEQVLREKGGEGQ